MNFRIVVRFRITDTKTCQTHVVEPGAPEMPGWNPHVVGWSLAMVGSGSAIEIDEPLEGVTLGIFRASNHVILTGQCPKSRAEPLPEISFKYGDEWMILDPMQYAGNEGNLYVRFDWNPLRIGSHVIEMEMERIDSA